ncbi:importin subunit alpha-3-like [Paramacrobiotus metropolitanus]|uniref:importin subunit alpha-3-like n=1 Tax=Paramacrobiotus metropolitanus TaxID=2943436 RepID=UPI00244654F5|nr:importin subunit alpha-3-like [Paramacrobiotus metropolitanus]
MEARRLDADEALQRCLVRMRSPNLAHQYQGLQNLRNLLQAHDCSPRHLLKTNALPLLVDVLGPHVDESLQLEAAWIVTFLTASDAACCLPLVADGALHALLEQLDSAHLPVVRQAAGALANLLADDAELRCVALQAGLLGRLRVLLQAATPRPVLRLLSWLLLTLARPSPPPLPLEVVEEVLPKLLWMSSLDDHTVRINAIWSLTYLSESSTETAQRLGQDDKIVVLVKNVSVKERNQCLFPSLRLLASLLWALQGDDLVPFCDCIPKLAHVLNNTNRQLQKLALVCLERMATNCALGALKIVGIPGLLRQTIAHVHNRKDGSVSLEAVQIVGRIVQSGTREQLAAVLEAGALEALAAALVTRDTATLRRVLTVLDQLVQLLAECGLSGTVRGRLQASLGLVHLENLQCSDDEVVHKAACATLDQLFHAADASEI